MPNVKVQIPKGKESRRVEAEGKMSKFKIQMTNDGVRATSPGKKYTGTFHGHETRTLGEPELG